MSDPNTDQSVGLDPVENFKALMKMECHYRSS